MSKNPILHATKEKEKMWMDEANINLFWKKELKHDRGEEKGEDLKEKVLRSRTIHRRTKNRFC